MQNGLDDFFQKIVELRAFYDSSHLVDPNEFELFTRQIGAAPSQVMRLIWAPRVTREGRDAFERNRLLARWIFATQLSETVRVAIVPWLVAWLLVYEKPERHPRLGAAERAFIGSDPKLPATHMPWASLFGYRQTWSFAAAKFLTDPIWWMYLFWLPDFFSRNYGLSLLELGPPIIIIYVVADVGSVGGGWLSSKLIRRGWSVNAARKTAMLGCALAVVPIVFATQVQSVWGAVALVSLATAAHQGWSANLFTFASDMFPRQAVGSVVGLGGFAGAVGGMLIAKVTGYVLEMTGSYTTVLLIAGGAYLLALAIVQILTPKLEPARI